MNFSPRDNPWSNNTNPAVFQDGVFGSQVLDGRAGLVRYGHHVQERGGGVQPDSALLPDAVERVVRVWDRRAAGYLPKVSIYLSLRRYHRSVYY